MYGEYNFFSYNKPVDWQNGIYENLHNSEDGLEINQIAKYSISRTIATNELVGPSTILDLTVNQSGRIYLLDKDLRIWAYDESNDHLELMIKSQHSFSSVHTSLLSVSSLLFTADTEKGRITAYSESNGQVYWEVSNVNNVPFHPITICADDQNFIYVLAPTEPVKDEGIVEANGKLGIFQFDLAGTLHAVFEDEYVTMNRDLKVTQLKQYFLLNVSKDRSLYLYDKVQNVMIHFRLKHNKKTYFSFLSNAHLSGLGIDSQHNFYLGDGRTIDIDDEDNRYLYKFSPSGSYQMNVTGFRGRADQIEFDSKDRLFIWDALAEMITILKYKNRTMEMASTKLPEGIFISTSLDTTSEKITWHKYTIDGEIPPETQLRFSSFASDRKEVIINGEYVDLDEYLLDPNVSFSEKNDTMNTYLSQPDINAKDALFKKATGRYLWIKIEFIGSDQKTPQIQRLRIYFPRMSYLSYLPAAYQEDEQSSEFLERFLAIFEKFLLDMEDQIKNVPAFFNPDKASGPFLLWLSSWLGLKTDETWSEAQVREFIKRAPHIYRKRGTRDAISEIIEIFTGQTPVIIENFQVNDRKHDSSLKEVLLQLYGDNPYRFFVLIPPGKVRSEKERLSIQRILDAEKPAFTEAKLVVLEPWIYLDMHAYLGLNTYLSEKSLMKLSGETYMPSDTLIIDVDRDNRYDIHTRIGLDSELE